MLHSLIGLSLAAFLGTAHAAEPVLVPDFTAGTGDEFAVTVMIQGLVTDQLLADGHIVLTNDVVTSVVGADALTNCSARPDCPIAVLPKLPSRIAAVARITRTGGTLVGHLEMWEQSTPTAVDVRDIPIAPGSEHLFASEVSQATRALLDRVGPSPDTVLMAAARLIAGQDPTAAPPGTPPAVPPPSTGPVAVPPPVTQAQPPPVVDLDGPTDPPVPLGTTPSTAPPPSSTSRPPPSVRTDEGPHTRPTGELLASTGVHPRHLLGSEKHFRKSGLDPRDWIYQATPHAGRFTVEVRGGIGDGDVDRSADVRVERVGNGQRLQWSQEGPRPARRVRGGLFLGYAPATFIDTGVLFGLQYGQKGVSRGWVAINEEGEVIDSSTADRDFVQAVQFSFEPRVRAYVVPVGPAKPYFTTGFEFRVFGETQLPQPAGFTYPVPAGGVVPGWVGGGGIMIDPGPIFGILVEGAYTRHFGPRSNLLEEGNWPYDRPGTPDPTHATASVAAGVQFRI